MLDIPCGACYQLTAAHLVTRLGNYGVRQGNRAAPWLCPRCYATKLADEERLAIATEHQKERIVYHRPRQWREQVR